MLKFFALSVFFIPGLLMAQEADSLLKQLTTAEYKADVPDAFQNNQFPYSRLIEVSKKHCKELRYRWSQVSAKPGTPEYQRAVEKLKPLTRLCYQSASVNDEGEVTAFTMTNETKNGSNPRTSPYGSDRQWIFSFSERSKQDMHVRITDNSGLTGKISNDFLETSLIFIPRKVLPYMEFGERNGRPTRKVYLPTNEAVVFDAESKEIWGGALKELPMDMNPSRHHRNFAGILYKGKGIMIRADRRAGTPEHIYSQAYNVNERIKVATITHQEKTCYVSKDLIWQGAFDLNFFTYFKHSTDQEFLDEVINPLCGWNLDLEDIQ